MRCVSVCMCVLVGERVVCHGISVDLYSHLTLWNSFVQILQLHRPSGGESNGGDRQYMWYLFGIERLENSNVMRVNLIKMLNENKKKRQQKKVGYKATYPRSQSSQNNSWSSLSDVPQMEQYLHSIHCHLYLFTEMIMFGVNWRHDGWPERPQSEQDTKSSGTYLGGNRKKKKT